MKSRFESIHAEIIELNAELQQVMNTLEELKKKDQSNAKIKKDAYSFIEKADEVIRLAEIGEVEISKEQKEKLIKTLLKIRVLFKS